MPRNLNNRVEVLFPIESESHRKRILALLELLLSDNQKSHEMKSTGEYRHRRVSGKLKINAQNELLRQAKENAVNLAPAPWQVQSANPLIEK